MPYRPHPFKVIRKLQNRWQVDNKDRSKGVVCFVAEETDDMIIQFEYFGILCVTRKNMVKSLHQRRELNIDPFMSEYTKFLLMGADFFFNYLFYFVKIYMYDE